MRGKAVILSETPQGTLIHTRLWDVPLPRQKSDQAELSSFVREQRAWGIEKGIREPNAESIFQPTNPRDVPLTALARPGRIGQARWPPDCINRRISRQSFERTVQKRTGLIERVAEDRATSPNAGG